MFSTIKKIYNALFIDQTKLRAKVPDGVALQEPQYIREYGELTDWVSLKQIVKKYDELVEKFPNYRSLFVFGDVGQCEYTTMHAMSDVPYDDEADDTEIFRATVRYLEENKISVQDINKEFDWDKDSFKLLRKINTSPVSFWGRDTIAIHLCPTTHSPDVLAAQLNGYWADDFQPLESSAFIRFLHEKYGYEFMGIECSYFFFCRAKGLDIREGKALCRELADIYKTDAKQLENVLLNHLIGRTLILPYGQNFVSDYMEE